MTEPTVQITPDELREIVAREYHRLQAVFPETPEGSARLAALVAAEGDNVDWYAYAGH